VTRDSLQALSKLGEVVDGRCRIVSQPPILIPERELRGMYGLSVEDAARGIRDQFRACRATLPDDRRLLLERFERAHLYAGLCGWTLARAHAQSGVPVAVAAYLGMTDAFDRSVTELAQLYADRNERDHEPFATAVRSGRLEALEGV
jgi:hypothetical protein